MSSIKNREADGDSISGGDEQVDAVVGDPACAVSVDCAGGMTVSPAADTAK